MNGQRVPSWFGPLVCGALLASSCGGKSLTECGSGTTLRDGVCIAVPDAAPSCDKTAGRCNPSSAGSSGTGTRVDKPPAPAAPPAPAPTAYDAAAPPEKPPPSGRPTALDAGVDAASRDASIVDASTDAAPDVPPDTTPPVFGGVKAAKADSTEFDVQWEPAYDD